MSIKASILTLGCRVNQYESDAIMQEFAKKGVEICDKDEVCDIYVINTCSVTAESDRKSKQFIRRCVAKNPNAVVIVTGCYSQINPMDTLLIDGVSFVCGNNAKSSVVETALQFYNEGGIRGAYLPNIINSKYDQMEVGAPMTRTRAFIKIEDGCDSKCAYCIIPKARGSVRSDSRENILSEIKRAVAEGCKEVVLTGIETASYGKDFKNGYSLADLLCEANEVEGLERIRLGSLDPVSITKDFVDKIKGLSKVMPHFHISMQTGCTRILNLMRRKYNIETATANIEYLKSQIPDIMLSADVITGFPGESDEDFEKTLAFFKEQEFMRLHIFPYSRRKGTVAYDMPNQVPEEIKKSRLKELSALACEIRKKLFSNFVKTHNEVKALFETFDGKHAYGHTESFIDIMVECAENIEGKILSVTLTGADSERLYGIISNF